jgi:ribonuclease HI
VDGSFRRQNIGGWGVYIRAPGRTTPAYHYGAAAVLSSPEAEVLGLLEGLRLLPSGIEVAAHSDFQGVWQHLKLIQRQRQQPPARNRAPQNVSIAGQRIRHLWELIKLELARFKRIVAYKAQENPRNLGIAHELSRLGSAECERILAALPSSLEGVVQECTEQISTLLRFRATPAHLAQQTG